MTQRQASVSHSRSIRPLATIGRWSTRHPWLAIASWLAFVVLAVGALAVTGSKQLQNGATGESARAENMLKLHQARPKVHEYAYLHNDRLRSGQPAFRAAIAKVTASMERALGGHVRTSIAADGHSALVAGPIGRPFSADALRGKVAAAGGAQITTVLDDASSDGNGKKRGSRCEQERHSRPPVGSHSKLGWGGRRGIGRTVEVAPDLRREIGLAPLREPFSWMSCASFDRPMRWRERPRSFDSQSPS
jgi:hypothetical protein